MLCSAMPYYTPLRYPGGKRRLVPVVTRLLKENGLKDVHYAEPYAGGAAIGLSLLFDEYASVIHINDLSRAVYAFWHTVLDENAELCRRIERVKVTMAEWRRQRAVYEAQDSANLIELGFAAFFLNRTNRSGIIGGGVIGGQQQTGPWGIDARFTKEDLVQRIRRIGRYRSRINLYQQDALKFTSDVVAQLGANVFTFYDPPYIANGVDLYLNGYTIDDHRELAARIGLMQQPWVVTYDHTAVREQLYPIHRRLMFGLKYTAQSRYEGREVMFLSDRLRVPSGWASGRSVVIARPSRGVTVYGKMENVKPHPEMNEGPSVFDRFQKAMKTIIAVPKDAVAERPKPQKKKRARAPRK